ncbi:MAG: SufS family cysteine desulfurase [Clostridiales bacterium]|nr:SufS family cysteine desulfurase [Clostridiales bacterium]
MTNIFKNDFEILHDDKYIYFDNAATTQRPKQVINAVSEFYRTINSNPLRGLYKWSVKSTAAYENARSKVAEFIGAEDSSEIIFTRNSTESINLIAHSWGLSNIKEGDNITVTILEHHSNLLPWQMVSRVTGASLTFIECSSDGEISDEEILNKIPSNTKLVSAAEISNVLGVRLPIEKISKRAHEVGAVMVVDGAQSAPHKPVDVKALGADFFVFSGHKVMAPMGIGVLYGKLSLLESMPPFLLGGEMIESVSRYDAVFAPVPEKFEAGTVNAAGAVGLAAAIDYVENIGFDIISQREEKLCRLMIEGIKTIPFTKYFGSRIPETHSGIVTFNIEGCHPHDVSSILDTENICIRAGQHCAQPLHEHLGIPASARASMYFYNDESEVERFLEALKKVRSWLGYGN